MLIEKRTVKHTERDAIQKEYIELTHEIKKLSKKKRKLEKQLKKYKPVNKNTKKQYKKMNISLYVLKLEDDCYYVGQSRNVYNRYIQHKNGDGSMFTKLHKPIKIIRQIKLDTNIECLASKEEDKLTLEYAFKYGVDKVRGGGYTQTKPHWPKDIVSI